mgnify:CR=1 FL=1
MNDQGIVETDKDLLTRYRGGDLDALERLVEKYRRPLFGFILNMVGASGDADEVFQEAWFRAIRSLESYTEKNFFGWLVRITRNLVIDKIRRRRPDVSLDEEPEEGLALGHLLPGRDSSPVRKMENADLCRKVAAAITALPEEQKEVFLMRVEAGISFKEIAEIQKVSINTALARMQYALAKMRPMLKEFEDM